MDKPSYIRNFGMKAWVILVELLLLVSCDNAIYDDEGDCSVASWCGKLTNRVKSLHPVITP